MSKAKTHKHHTPIEDTALIDSLRALGAKSFVIESSPGNIDIYLDVVSRSRRAHKLSGLKITLRNGVLSLHSRAQCQHDISWTFHDGEPAQRVADRMLAECSGNVVNRRHERTR
jgi:hypothetical protein